MAGGWFDPNAVNWFDESASQGGWFDETLQDASFGGGGGGGTVTFVQSAHGEAGSGVSPTATFSSNVTSGNLLVIVASAYRAGTPPHAFSLGDLTKSSGTATLGTAQLDIQHARSTGSNEGRVAIWSIPVTGTGSLTLSLAVNTGDYANLAAAEFSGADTTSGRLDTSLGNDGPGTGTGCVIGDMTSAGAGVFVGGFAAYTSTTSSWTPDGAFTTIFNVGDVAYNASAAIYRIVSSATTDSADVSISPGYDAPGWSGASAIYKAGSGGGTSTYSYTGTGGAVFAGSATLSKSKAYTPSGGGIAGGSATVAKSKAYTASGGAIAAGAATVAKSKTYTPTGGAVFAGAATSVKSKAYTPTGGAVFAGAATTAFQSAGSTTYPYVGSGGATFGGSATTAYVPFSDQPATEHASGGYGWANLARIERSRKRKRELEEEADRLEMALAADGLVTPSPEVVARFTVREYAPVANTFNKRTQRAIAYAERAQTALAYEMALRQVQKEIEDEEAAIVMLLALVS